MREESPRPPAGLDAETRELVVGLDRELADVRRYGERVSRQIHKLMTADLRRAEKRASRAERRADAAERELAAVRASSTWKAGRAVVALPNRIKGWRKS